MNACCDWCLTPVKVPDDYDPLQHAVYCCVHCYEKDVLFKAWQNDKYLNWLARSIKDERKP